MASEWCREQKQHQCNEHLTYCSPVVDEQTTVLNVKEFVKHIPVHQKLLQPVVVPDADQLKRILLQNGQHSAHDKAFKSQTQTDALWSATGFCAACSKQTENFDVHANGPQEAPSRVRLSPWSRFHMTHLSLPYLQFSVQIRHMFEVIRELLVPPSFDVFLCFTVRVHEVPEWFRFECSLPAERIREWTSWVPSSNDFCCGILAARFLGSSPNDKYDSMLVRT